MLVFGKSNSCHYGSGGWIHNTCVALAECLYTAEIPRQLSKLGSPMQHKDKILLQNTPCATSSIHANCEWGISLVLNKKLYPSNIERLKRMVNYSSYPPHERDHGSHVSHVGVVSGKYLCPRRHVPGEPRPVLLLHGCKPTLIEDVRVVPT